MGYRDPSPPEPTTIPYGRFPTSRSELRAGLAISLAIVGGVLLATTHVEHFHCERHEANVRCEESSSWLGVTTDAQTFVDGEKLGSVEGADPRLVAFLDEPDRSRLSTERRPGILVGLLASGLALFWLVIMLRATIRTAGRFVVEEDSVRGELRLCATRLRFFRARTIHPTAGLSRVKVEHGYLRRAHHANGSPGEPAGRLWLVYEDGRRRQLSPTLLPGVEVHETLAEQLRAHLGL
ncbi:MAG: hypothetical protein JJ863_36575 [Deltaproteobacteria bacterium]|nr:hypothetical protein [Deltaproteobacteria bacterium]